MLTVPHSVTDHGPLRTFVEVSELHERWQRQVQETEAIKEKAQEEASMWQERAEEEKKMRVKAEAAALISESKAEWAEVLNFSQSRCVVTRLR